MDSRSCIVDFQQGQYNTINTMELATKRDIMKRMRQYMEEEQPPMVIKNSHGTRLNSGCFFPKIGMTCGDIAICKRLTDNQVK